jgi:hypothetical protein
MPLRILPLLIFFALLQLPATALCSNAPEGGILILFSGSEPPPGASSFLHGVRSESREHPVTTLYLGLGPDADEEDALAAWKRLRSSADAAGSGVIAMGEPAVSFVRMFRPLAPLDGRICFVRQQPLPGTSATADNGTAANTVDMVFSAAPGTTTLITFTGTDAEAKALRHETGRRFRPYMNRAQLILPGFEKGREGLLTRRDILRIAANAPSGSSILLLGYPTKEAATGLAEAIVDRSRVPVFAGAEVPFVPGMKGVAATDWRAHGRAAARSVLDRTRAEVSLVPLLVQQDLPDEREKRAQKAEDASEEPVPSDNALTIAAAGVAAAVLATLFLKGRRG